MTSTAGPCHAGHVWLMTMMTMMTMMTIILIFDDHNDLNCRPVPAGPRMTAEHLEPDGGPFNNDDAYLLWRAKNINFDVNEKDSVLTSVYQIICLELFFTRFTCVERIRIVPGRQNRFYEASPVLPAWNGGDIKTWRRQFFCKNCNNNKNLGGHIWQNFDILSFQLSNWQKFLEEN